MKKEIILKIECSIDENLALTYSINGPETLREPLHQLINGSLNSLVEDYVFSLISKIPYDKINSFNALKSENKLKSTKCGRK